MRSKASFPFISANIIDKETGQLLFERSRTVTKGNLRFGILGLTTRVPDHVEDVDLLDPVEEGRRVLEELGRNTDHQIVLFNGSYREALSTRDSLEAADLFFLSGDTRTPVRRGGEDFPAPRIHRLGKQGKSLGVVRLEVRDSSEELADISTIMWRGSFVSRQLKRLGRKDPSRDLEEIYADNLTVLERVRRIRKERDSIEEQLAQLENTVQFEFVAMTQQIEDNSELLAMVNKTLAECKRIAKQPVRTSAL